MVGTRRDHHVAVAHVVAEAERLGAPRVVLPVHEEHLVGVVAHPPVHVRHHPRLEGHGDVAGHEVARGLVAVAGQALQVRLLDVRGAKLRTRLVVVRRVRLQSLVGVGREAGDRVDGVPDLLVARGGGGRDGGAVSEQAVLPEGPHVVEHDGLVGLVEVADGGEGPAVLGGGDRVLGLQRLAAHQCLALDGVQLVAALLGADLGEEPVVGRVLVVDDVVGRDVRDDTVHVARVETLVVRRGHAALAAARGQPVLLVDLLQGGEDAVLVTGGLPDVQVGPVGRVGPGGSEESILHGHLVAVDDGRRLTAARVGVDVVAGGEEHRRPRDVLVQQGQALLEGALPRLPVVHRLLVVQYEEAVAGVRLLLDQAHPGNAEDLVLDVRGGRRLRGCGRLRRGAGRAHGADEHHERQQPSERLAHSPSP